jgi:hypothetical protein
VVEADAIWAVIHSVLFAPPNVRKGVLPRMLSEILETRVMVKTSMTRAGPSQRNLQVVLHPDIDPADALRCDPVLVLRRSALVGR